jgi:dienelactone hydrolase
MLTNKNALGLMTRKSVMALFMIAMSIENADQISAQERVEIVTPPVPLSAFKVKRAKAQGITLTPKPGIVLDGVLSRPKGEGLHPAVVVLPESVEARPSYEDWAKYLNENGYVTLIVESLASRDEAFLRDDLPMNLLIDAQGGLAFLAALEDVDQKRISILGIGMSGWFVQRSLDVNFTRGADNLSFNAGVAIYPHCNPKMELRAPILVLAGGKDKSISMAACESLIELNRQKDSRTKLEVYPEATHFFENRAYSKNPEIRGENWNKPSLFDQNNFDLHLRSKAELEVLNFLNDAGAFE